MISTFCASYKLVLWSFDDLVSDITLGNWLGNWLWLILVQLHEFGKIELWLLKDLDLSDHAVILKWEDFAAFSLNLFANVFFQKHLDELLESWLLYMLLHNIHHLLSDELLMGCLGVAGGLYLLECLLGEGNAEHSENISIGGFGLNESLNEWIPLLNHWACFVFGNVHTVEIGVAVKSFNLINLESKFSPVVIFLLLIAICKGDIENSTSQTISWVGKTGCLVTWGQCDASLVKAWG